MVDASVPERSDASYRSSVVAPATPIVRPEDLWSSGPRALVDSGRYTIGWQRWSERKGGPGFVVIRCSGMGGYKAVERYPLTVEGWADAWASLVRLDPDTAEQVQVVLARRADAENGFLERKKLDAASLACLPAVIFLGGYVRAGELAAGKPYEVRFLDDRIAVLSPGALEARTEILYSDVEAVDIGGPGLIKSGGGFVGGGFGAVGAAEGMAVAALMNSLTTRTRIKTIVRMQASGAELFFLNTATQPEALRIQLSRALGAIREAQTVVHSVSSQGQRADSVSLVDELARLGQMLEAGLLTREEFNVLKRRLITGQ